MKAPKVELQIKNMGELSVKLTEIAQWKLNSEFKLVGYGYPENTKKKKSTTRTTTADLSSAPEVPLRSYGDSTYMGDINIVKIQKALEEDGQNIPLSLYLARPHMRFQMGGMVVGVGGEQTGFTVVGNSNFELSDEATTKTALGHYTTYFKPIIHTPKNVMVCPDAVFQGYHGGGGVRMTSYENYQRPSGNDPGLWNDIVVMGTTKDDAMDGVLPLCGTFDGLNSGFKSFEYLSSGGSKNFMLQMYSQRFQERTDKGRYIGSRDESMEGMGNMDRYAYGDRYRGYNLLCFQGRQKCFKATSEHTGEFSREIMGRGHLRDVEYVDSSIREWTGNMSFREEPNLRLDVAAM